MHRLVFWALSSFLFLAALHPFVAFGEKLPGDFNRDVFGDETPAEILYSKQSFLTATRSLQHIRRVTDNVTVITREEIDRWPVADLDEALSLINGIVIQDDGNIGQVATAQIYGSKAREVRVMIDGITFNATTTGGIADLSQIPLDLVEKIEIIKGASSSVWGSAMGGVINIITRPTGKTWIPRGSASLAFGEFSTQRERAELSGRLGPLAYYGFGSYVESGGFRPNSDELEKRSFLKTVLPLTEEWNFAESFGYSGSKVSEFQLPDVGTTTKRKVYSRYGSAGLQFEPGEDLHSDLFYKISERSFRRETRLFPSQAFFQFSKARSMIHEISFNNVWDMTETQTLVLGSDVGVEVYRDAVFRATTTPANVNKETMRHAYYLNYQQAWKSFDFTAGSRLDATNSYGVHFNPSLGTVYHLPWWKSLLRANVSRAFNAPSLVDRYLTSGTTVANPDLEAEKAIGYNFGIETEPISWFHGQAVFFQTFVRDAILTVRRDDGLRQAVNISRERRTGFETNLSLGPWWGFEPSYGTAYVSALGPGGVPLQDRPRFTQDIKLNYHTVVSGFKFNFHIAGRYTDIVKFSSFTDPRDQVFIFDSKIVLTFPKVVYGNLSLFVEGENLFNEDFAFDGSRDRNPQSNFEAGVKYEF